MVGDDLDVQLEWETSHVMHPTRTEMAEFEQSAILATCRSVLNTSNPARSLREYAGDWHDYQGPPPAGPPVVPGEHATPWPRHPPRPPRPAPKPLVVRLHFNGDFDYVRMAQSFETVAEARRAVSLRVFQQHRPWRSWDTVHVRIQRRPELREECVYTLTAVTGRMAAARDSFTPDRDDPERQQRQQAWEQQPTPPALRARRVSFTADEKRAILDTCDPSLREAWATIFSRDG